MVRCAACGRDSPEGFTFCGHCGSRVGAEPTREERKVVSALFADLEGFTERSHDADPEDVQATLRPYYAQLKELIERFGGVVEKFVGDAVVGVFGAPMAHEDDPERAVRAALRIQEAIAELNRLQPDLALAVRAAVCTGEALVSRQARPERGEGFVAGDVLNTASRLQHEAPPGGVVVDQRTYVATSEIVEYEQLPDVKVKGKPLRIPIWLAKVARRISARESRRPSVPLVDRARELTLLSHAFEGVVETKRVHLITITGEPGLGKTRLARELLRLVEGPPRRGRWLQGHCLPYAEGTAFGPLGEAIKSFVDILDSDAPVEAGAKLAQAVVSLVDDAVEQQWLLAWLASLVGAETTGFVAGAEEREAFRAWARFLHALSARSPVVLALEDVHWADDRLVAFVSHLTEACAERPLLLACTARPEFFDEHHEWGGGRRNSTTLSLTPLIPDQTESLVSALLGVASLPEPARVSVVERAGGNPLYALEFARLFAERGALSESAAHAGPISALPETVQAIIAARLDALPEQMKQVLLDASVVGEVFWAGAVASVGEGDEQEVLEALQGLGARDLVRPNERSSLEGQEEYSFLHGVVRDVAYAEVPRPERMRKHRRAAEWVESLGGEHLPDLADRAAHHLLAALEAGRAARLEEDVESLVPSARQAIAAAAERAMRVDATAAERDFRRALDLFPPGHPDRARLLAAAGEAAHQAGRLEEAAEHYDRAVSAFRAQGDLLGAGETMVRLSRLMWWRGDTTNGRALLADAVELLGRLAPSREFALGCARMAGDHVLAGRAATALEWAESAIELAGQLDLEDVYCRAQQYRGLARCELGDVTGGLADLARALEDGLRLGLGHETATAYDNLGDWVWYTEGPRAGLEVNRTGVEFAERRGEPETWTWTKAETLWMLFDAGEWDETLRVADEVLEWDRAHGGNQVGVIASTHRALVLARRGPVDDAALMSDDFLSRARRIGDPEVLVPALTTAAIIAAERGEVGAALDLVGELDVSTQDKPPWRARDLPDAVEICVRAGAADVAERLLQGAADTATRHALCVLTARARLEEDATAHQSAVAKYERAVAGWRAFGCPLNVGRCLLGLARSSLALGREWQASAIAAKGVFEALGAQTLTSEASRLLLIL